MGGFNLQDFTFSFLSVLFEGVPFLLLGAILSGLIEAFVPARWMTRLMPSNSIAAVAIAGVVGIVFPMCECGVVPVIRRLLGKGLPVACAVTYMLASPIVNPIVAVSTLAAFPGESGIAMASGRMALGYLIAVLVGAISLRFKPEQLLRPDVLEQLTPRRRSSFGLRTGDSGETAVDLEDKTPEAVRKVGVAVRGAATDFLDTMVYFVIGAALASAFNTGIPRSIIDPLATNPIIGAATLMVLAFLISICSTSDAFIAATFTKFAPAAKLAFLTYGPMMDMKLVFLYGMVFRRRVVLALAIGLFIVVAIVSLQYGNVAFAPPSLPK